MYINKSDEPIAAFRSDNYTRASLAICTLGIVVLSIASVVYQSIDKFSFGLKPEGIITYHKLHRLAQIIFRSSDNQEL